VAGEGGVVATIGIDAIDELVDGVRASDNLVVLATDDHVLRRIVDAFVRANAATRSVVVARTVSAASPPLPEDDIRALDWGAVVSGADAAADLHAADDAVGAGAAFVIDGLSSLAARLGDEAALELFLATCPHLYERQSVALWPVRADAHPAAFLSRLEEITQVVLELTVAAEGLQVEVRKADGRADATIGRRVVLGEVDGRWEPVGAATSGRERLGALVRTQRTIRGLSQAELARRIGISPSALSQVERGVRGLSGERLMRVWEALDVPFGPADTRVRGYTVARRGGQPEPTESGGATVRTVVDDPMVGTVHRVHLRPGASGRAPLVSAKTPETVLVLEGVVDVEVGGHPETLQAGDGLVAWDVAIGAWHNPAETPAELVWFVHRSGQQTTR
jgi:transcriptional regulator with XRE-family HTH domain